MSLSRLLARVRGKPYPNNMSTSVPPSQVAIFAAGCFWGVEHIFLKQWPINQNKGILKSAVGYTGGRADSTNPTYQDVCLGTTNHAEALRIEFDPSKVTYDELVGPSPYSVGPRNCFSDVLLFAEYFYRTHDPTTLDSQGVDRGTRAFDHALPLHLSKSLTYPTYRRVPLCHILQHPGARVDCPSRNTGGAGEALYSQRAEDCHSYRGSGALVRC